MKTVRIAGSATGRGQQSIEFQYDEQRALEAGAEWLESHLRDAVASGVRFRAGESIQIGSMECVFGPKGRGLELLEPDFESFPIEYEPGVTRTLELFLRQRSVAESYGVEQQMKFSFILHCAVVCRRYADVSDWCMIRYDSKANATGWCVTCCDAAHDHQDRANLTIVSIYELMLKAPAVAGFLALPTDSEGIIRESGAPSFVIDEEVRDVLPGSYVEREYGKRRT